MRLMMGALLGAMLLSGCMSTLPKTDPALLSGKSFMWAEAANEHCEVPPSISFRADGNVSGDAGCNRMLGTWSVDKDGFIDLSHLGATRRMCSPDLMKIEDAFFKNLHETKTIVGEGENLHFLNDKGELIMKLVPEAAGTCN